MPTIATFPSYPPVSKTSRRAESVPACQSESAPSPRLARGNCTITAYPSAPTVLRTLFDESTAPVARSTSLHARPALPSAKALGKRKHREVDERDIETSPSPSKLSRLSAWRKHAGRYILTPVLGPAKEVDEPPSQPVGISDYDASSEGSSQRSSTSPPPDGTAHPPVSSLTSRSGAFKFIARRPPVCSPAPSYANLSYQSFSPGPSQPGPSQSRGGQRSRPPISSPPVAIFSPRTRRVPYISSTATSPPRAYHEPETRVIVLPALSVRVRNLDLPGAPTGRSRVFGTASPVVRPPRRSRVLPAGTVEPTSSIGSGTIVFFNEMNEIRAYRVAPDIHSYAEKFVRTRPVPPSTRGTRTPMLRSTRLPREPVRCITPEPPRCATPEPLDLFPERHSPQPSSSGDSAATLCTYSPQLSTSLTLVNDSDDVLF